jgi:hypothetical protein
MYISSSTVTLTSCTFNSNNAVRRVVYVVWLMLQFLTSLFLSLFLSVAIRMCVKWRCCAGRLADVARTNLCISFSVLSVDFSKCVKRRRCSGRFADANNTNLFFLVSVVSFDFSLYVKCRRFSYRFLILQVLKSPCPFFLSISECAYSVDVDQRLADVVNS